MLVRIVKNWNFPDLMRQTPGSSGVWDGIRFTEEEVEECDFLVALNCFAKQTAAVCNPANVMAVIQEPPVAEFQWLKNGFSDFHRIVSVERLRGGKIINDQPALPWHVGKSYDELRGAERAFKTGLVSWVTSSKSIFPGHKERMSFLDFIRNKISFDLWGRGFAPLHDKWDGVAPYKYSFAVENYRCRWYWTEKLADCYLAWSMPIYYGCENIYEYFPPESMIRIDIHRPRIALKIIEKEIPAIQERNQKKWEKKEILNLTLKILSKQ